MSARAVNLIPLSRRTAKRVRGRARHCAVLCVLFALLAIGGSIGWRMTLGQDDPQINSELARASADIDAANKALASANSEIELARSRIAANRHIISQPDWSLLLALLGEQTGRQIVLRSFELKPDDAATAGKGSGSTRLALRITGFGRSSQAVAQFGLRLEETKLFARVTLVDTTHDTFLAGDAFAFRIECPLDDGR